MDIPHPSGEQLCSFCGWTKPPQASQPPCDCSERERHSVQGVWWSPFSLPLLEKQRSKSVCHEVASGSACCGGLTQVKARTSVRCCTCFYVSVLRNKTIILQAIMLLSFKIKFSVTIHKKIITLHPTYFQDKDLTAKCLNSWWKTEGQLLVSVIVVTSFFHLGLVFFKLK